MTPKEIAELLDFKESSAVAQHLTLTKPYDDIYLIVPRAASEHKSKDSPVAQLKIIVKALLRMVDKDLIKTIIWDGMSNTGDAMTDQFAREKTNKVDTSKHWEMELDDDSDDLEDPDFIVPGINWLDNGMSQRNSIMHFRQPLMSHPKNDFNLAILGHDRTKDGFVGMDVGGPSSIKKFPGGAFTNWFFLEVDGDGQRVLHTTNMRVKGYQCVATLKTRPGVKLNEEIFNEDRSVVFPNVNDEPDKTLKFQQDFYNEVMRATGHRWLRFGITAAPDAGKSLLASALLTLPGNKPAAIVMADMQTGLPTYWPEALGLER